MSLLGLNHTELEQTTIILWDPGVSGGTEGLSTGSANSSSQDATYDWFLRSRYWHLELFLISAAVLFLVSLLANPLILICIVSTRNLRQESRYLLLANTLLSDIIFSILNLVVSICNMQGWPLHRLFCVILIVIMVTSYCSGVLTITLMLLDTYLAVHWPLHYENIVPSSRTKKILPAIWIMASLYPVTIMIILEILDNQPLKQQKEVCLMLLTLGSGPLGNEMVIGFYVFFSLGALLCSSVVVFCLIRLYWITKTAGLWQRRYSRAKVTLIVHTVMLLLYFSPGLVFAIEIILLQKDTMSLDVKVWIHAANSNFLMMLPRAFFPYLYGLRYREISNTLKGLFRRRKISQLGVLTSAPCCLSVT
ncbi:putative G-protein coupled receptor 148 [Acipenser oxyrinchus oxyrinchus]|uniref:G-protein coupled receptor 148 n=1 Tax=Acipenser oxyrinchus oxyrinchus TaxID=40147 RepID=A0AAD8DGN4_ACIOX|nr:putative G-protein coupled receptor 148 [Acipenser oxyrinchus oxyrinchus]